LCWYPPPCPRNRERYTYVQSFRFNAPVFAALERVAAPPLVAGLAVLIGILTASWLRRRSEAWPSYAFAWPMAASILCAPVVYPWYLLWLLPSPRSTSPPPLPPPPPTLPPTPPPPPPPPTRPP